LYFCLCDSSPKRQLRAAIDPPPVQEHGTTANEG